MPKPEPTESVAEKPSFLSFGIQKAKAQASNKRTKPLSEAEAEAIRESLHDLFMDLSDFLDKQITATVKGHQPCMIWSTIDEKECNQLVEWRLNRAKKSAVVAEATLKMIEAFDHLKIGMILLPRFMETIQFYSSYGGFSLK